MIDDFYIRGFLLPWYAIIVVFTIIILIVFITWINKKDGYILYKNKFLLGIYIIVLTIVGFAGARILAYFEHIIKCKCNSSFIRIFDDIVINSYGASWYGGFILVTGFVVLISFVFYNKYNRIAFLNYHAMLVSLAYALGRQACFISADGCYGIPTNSIFGMQFLHGIKPTILPVYPTPLFESIISFLLFLGIFKFRKTNNLIPGAIFLIVFGSSRFLIEFIRRNSEIMFGLTMAQLISIVLIVTGLIIFSYQLKLKIINHEK